MLRARKNRRRIDPAAVRTAVGQGLVRAAKLVALLVVLAGVAVGAGWGTMEGRRWLYTSPTFAIEKIEFEGLAHASEEELLRLSGLGLGENIFELDASEAERALAAYPWVRRVSIERVYPRKLVVRVIEHVPAALAEMGGLYYVNDAGKAFKKLAPGEEADFPILVGIGREEYAAKEEEVEELFRQALDAIQDYREAGLEKRAPLSEVRVDRRDGLTFFCGRNAVAVKLGFDSYPEKFDRLGQLLTELSRRSAKAEVIHLDNRARPGWVAVQMAKATGAAAGAAESEKRQE